MVRSGKGIGLGPSYIALELGASVSAQGIIKMGPRTVQGMLADLVHCLIGRVAESGRCPNRHPA